MSETFETLPLAAEPRAGWRARRLQAEAGGFPLLEFEGDAVQYHIKQPQKGPWTRKPPSWLAIPKSTARPPLPAPIQEVLDAMPAPKPAYQYQSTLANVDTWIVPNAGGLYLIIFPGKKLRAYSGESGDLRERLMKHRLCAKSFGLGTHLYTVYVWYANLSRESRRDIEKSFHVAMRRRHEQALLTNILDEMELEILGWTE